jgi:outer membrane protein assembly factor BamB
MVAACNKNGILYAFRAADLAAGPVWQLDLGGSNDFQCLAAATWDGRNLFAGGISGEVAEVDPATGTPIWSVTLPHPVVGSPTLDGAGVLAVPTTGKGGGTYLLNSATGAILATLSLGADFAQPVFADNYLFVPTTGQGMTAYKG